MAKAVLGFNGGRTTTFFGAFPGVPIPIGRKKIQHPSSSVSCRAAEIGKKSSSSDYWVNIQSDIELHLKKSIPLVRHAVVLEPMHYFTFAAPPRTRAPALCIASWELVGGSGDRYSSLLGPAAMAAASAIHLVHAASYAHGNMPLSSSSTTTATTVQHKFRPNIELLTGDGILAFGFELLGRSMELLGSQEKNNYDDDEDESLAVAVADRILRVIVEISKASGGCQGIIKINDDKEKKNRQGELLHGCGAACGAILGGGSEEEIDKLRKYGEYVGMIQGLVHGNSSNNNTESMVKKLRALAMEQLASFHGTNKKIVESIYDDILLHH